MDRITRLRIGRNALLILLILLAMALLVRFQSVEDPQYQSSRAYVETMEDVFREIESGGANPEDYSRQDRGFTGFRLAEPQMIGLIGEHAGACYVVWQRANLGAGAGRLAGGLSCVPDSRLAFSASYVEQVVVIPADPGFAPEIEWDRLLPQARTPAWFVLVMALLVWLAFDSLVSITIIMYRRPRKT